MAASLQPLPIGGFEPFTPKCLILSAHVKRGDDRAQLLTLGADPVDMSVDEAILFISWRLNLFLEEHERQQAERDAEQQRTAEREATQKRDAERRATLRNAERRARQVANKKLLRQQAAA